jgi:uncharacterized membrane protein required for colicin V production
MSVIDILFLAIIVVFAIFSYRRGILRTVLEVVAFILAIVLAFFATKPVAKVFYNGFMRGSIEDHIEDAIQDINFESKEVSVDQGAKIVYDNIPDFAKKVAKGTGISESRILSRTKTYKFTNASATNMILEKVVDPIVLPATESVTFILLSALFIFLLRLFAKMLSKEDDSDGFTVNKLLGGLLGIAKGVAVIYVVCAALQLIYYSNADTSQGFGQILSKSEVFNFMISNNPIIDGLNNIF